MCSCHVKFHRWRTRKKPNKAALCRAVTRRLLMCTADTSSVLFHCTVESSSPQQLLLGDSQSVSTVTVHCRQGDRWTCLLEAITLRQGLPLCAHAHACTHAKNREHNLLSNVFHLVSGALPGWCNSSSCAFYSAEGTLLLIKLCIYLYSVC